MPVPLKVSLGYWLLGTVYIVLSDSILGASKPVLDLSMLKGVLFITITAVLLYFLLRRYFNRSNAYQQGLDTIVNRTSDMLWMVDSEHRFVLANAILCKELGVRNSSELLGRKTLDFTTEELYNSIWKHRYDRAFKGETIRFLHRADPPRVDFQLDFTLYPVFSKDGSVDRVVCFGHDVTALKKVQNELEKQNAALKEIAWMQSHEVRKPLANIMGLISAIDGDIVDNPELKDILIHIKSESKELDGIIRKIVDQTLEGASSIDWNQKSDFDDDSERG